MKNFFVILVFIIFAGGTYFFLQSSSPDNGTYEEGKGDFKGAVDVITKSLSNEQHQKNILLYVSRARNERCLNNYKAAEADIKKAVELLNEKIKSGKEDKGSSEANIVYIEQSKYFEDLKQYDAAMGACKKALENLDRSEVHNQMAWIYEAQGDLQKAEEERKKSVSMSASEWTTQEGVQPNEVALHERAMFYKRRQKLDAALDDLEQAIKMRKCNTALADRGDIYYEKGMYDEAIDDYTTVINSSDRFSYYRARARAYTKQKKFKDALSDYDKALSLNADDNDSKQEREALLLEMKK